MDRRLPIVIGLLLSPWLALAAQAAPPVTIAKTTEIAGRSPFVTGKPPAAITDNATSATKPTKIDAPAAAAANSPAKTTAATKKNTTAPLKATSALINANASPAKISTSLAKTSTAQNAIVKTPSLPATKPAATDVPRLHALLIFDTDAETISQSIVVDQQHMLGVLGHVVDPQGRRDRVKITSLSGRDATPERILEYFTKLKIAPNDSLLVYYTGHGAHSKSEGHQLAMKNGYLNRSALRGAMQQANARFAVLLTDSCDNSRTEGDAKERISTHVHKPFAAGEAPQWETFSKLFFDGPGDLVDVNSSKPGQPSESNKKLGGFFTAVLAHAFCEAPAQIADKADLDWKGFLVRINTLVDQRFVSSQQQTVCVHYMHTWPQHFWDKALLVQNDSPHVVKLHVQYQTRGQNDWTTTPTTWTVEPGKSGVLRDKRNNDALVSGTQVRIWGESTDGKFSWTGHKVKPIRLADEPFGYADQAIGKSTFRLQ